MTARHPHKVKIRNIFIMQTIFKKKISKVVMIGSVLVFMIIIKPDNFFNPARNFFSFLLAPFEKIFYSIAIKTQEIRDFGSSIGNLKHENEQLIMENQRLLSENSLLQNVSNENVILRQQLELLPRDQFDLVSAFVISQDPNGMGNWLQIDKGSSSGINKGDSVIVSKGILVGRVEEAFSDTAKIALLTNPESTINVATLKNGTKGVAKGEYGLGITFDMILQTAALNIGDDVITSGIGGDIPKGLYVGKVQEIHSSDDHLFQQAVISSPVQASKLQVLFVIKAAK